MGESHRDRDVLHQLEGSLIGAEKAGGGLFKLCYGAAANELETVTEH